MFKPRSPLPFGVEVERFYDKLQIDNGNGTLTFFSPSPSNAEIDNNYTNNPLSENYNHVLLGMGVDVLTKVIRQDANIDPAYVINNLNDAVIKLSTNRGRTRDILHPLKDYLNFNGISVSDGILSDDSSQLTISIPSTGMRHPDNLFLIKPQENWQVTVEFNSDTWPTTANWTSAGIGRFGLNAEVWMAKMTDEQLEAYTERLEKDAGYPAGL